MKAIIVLLCVLSTGLGIIGYRDELAIEKQQKEITDLAKRFNQVPQNGNLDLQAKCAKQAQEIFKEGGWKATDMALLTNHYNPKLNRCFVEIESTDDKTIPGKTSIQKTLSDAYEGRLYANYFWISVDGKKYRDVAPRECKVTLPDGEDTNCKSSDEFDKLLEQYMQ